MKPQRSRAAPPVARSATPLAVARSAAPPPVWTSVLAAAGCLALYVTFTPHASGGKDSSEFTAVLGTLGLAHPTGYPLYTLIGHAFVRALHALGAGWPWAANVWSAVGGGVAMGLWHAFGSRRLARAGVRPRAAALIALLPVAALGLNPVWTDETTVAEVNSWHLAWVAAACWMAAETLQPPAAKRGAARGPGRAAAWGVLVGVGLSHHSTSVLFSLPLTLALIAAPWPSRWRALAAFSIGAALPLLSWSYVYYRSLHPAAVQWGSLGPGLGESWNHLTAAGYRHYFGAFAPSSEQRAMLASSVYPWLAPGMIALLLWARLAGAEPRPLRAALAAAALLQCGAALLYGVSDPSTYFLPALALGLFVLPAAVTAWRPLGRAAPALAVLLAVGLSAIGWRWSREALERRETLEKAETFLHQMWSAVPIRRGFVLWDEDMCYRLIQYQQLDHERPDLVVVRPLLLMDAGARSVFRARHGFDPLGGGPSPPEGAADSRTAEAFADRIADGINRSSPDSVILFLPREPSLRLLPKPAAPRPG